MLSLRFVSLVSLSALVLAACATETVTPDTSVASRPFFASVEDAIAYIDAQPACDGFQDHEIRKAENRPTTRPTRTRTCIPFFPRRLQDRGYNAGCIAVFDLDDGGTPNNIRTACNTISVSGFTETYIADAMFERLMQRAMSEMRFLSAQEETRDVKRTNVRQPLKFAFEEYEHLITIPEAPNS